ncbi:hypothetical protein DUI87_20413 [Hirundo rustica rustica]|uniref:Uncharacterized protein n=1 Tax=Hirundo rustica rustica TaxID=333673 RepID=A0A3M0JQV0_HIRRU|nr:hypothetical protein DUI87_20413 [Hirundo rustica rustica]
MIKFDLDQELATKSPRVNNDQKEHKMKGMISGFKVRMDFNYFVICQEVATNMWLRCANYFCKLNDITVSTTGTITQMCCILEKLLLQVFTRTHAGLGFAKVIYIFFKRSKIFTHLNQRKKSVYSAPPGKRAFVFVDDLNMPAKEKYGAQPPIELLQQ